jgi:hypothetical protein
MIIRKCKWKDHTPHSNVRDSKPCWLTICQGTYACLRPDRYTYGNYSNLVANMDASDIRCRQIGKLIARNQRLIASQLYRMAVTRPGSRVAVTLSPSFGADLLGCIHCIGEKEWKGLTNHAAYVLGQTHKSPYRSVPLRVIFRRFRRTGKLHLPLTEIRRW